MVYCRYADHTAMSHVIVCNGSYPTYYWMHMHNVPYAYVLMLSLKKLLLRYHAYTYAIGNEVESFLCKPSGKFITLTYVCTVRRAQLEMSDTSK